MAQREWHHIRQLIAENTGYTGEIVIKGYRSSGRSRLVTAELRSQRRSLIVKMADHGDEPAREAEMIDFVCRNFRHTPNIVFVSRELSTFAAEFLPLATTLVPLLSQAALAALASLGEPLAALHRMVDTEDRPPHESRPVAANLDPVVLGEWMQASPAAKAFIRKAQESHAVRAALARVARNTQSPEGFIHGDLKLDNILIGYGRPLLIDFELAGTGPIVRDLAAVLGSMLHIWVRTLKIGESEIVREADEDGSVLLSQVQGTASEFLAGYCAHYGVAQVRDIGLSDALVQWLIGRAYADCFYETVAPPTAWVMLQVAHNIARGYYPFDVS
jgi:serine/threonine protein kinase